MAAIAIDAFSIVELGKTTFNFYCMGRTDISTDLATLTKFFF